ncbi:hypothetical protein [Mesorhizobium sp.]|uniref:hypothetical protein n=1 Tax=Mesorhizobium sp. TaxID=1871066 RepID=UPI0025F7EB74|nr:hypothetical protein [Mesorhizobium sp.]
MGLVARVPAVSVGAASHAGQAGGLFVAYETVERLKQRIDDPLAERLCRLTIWASFPLRAAVASSEP